ncbi:hypothetical protein ACFXP3_04570 [Streptomyces sp. NPDC059096]|uniref:hypothetical protein n=1 Tax=Streptomyces sp. NPDC059096 TaxID=3346727 RepID=UPI0036BD4347
MRQIISRHLRAVTTPVASEDKRCSCGGMDTCGCGGRRPIITSVPSARTVRTVCAGWIEDEEARDDRRGFERDETDQVASRPVRHLTAQNEEGDPLPRREPGETIPPLLRPRRCVRAVPTTVVREVAA